MFSKPVHCLWILILCLGAPAAPLHAVVTPERPALLAGKEVRHPDLDVSSAFQRLAELPADVAALAHHDLEHLGIGAEHARLDRRGGRWGTLFPAEPLLPGDGIGNHLRWDAQGLAAPGDAAELREAAWEAFREYLRRYREALRIDLAELSPASDTVTSNAGDSSARSILSASR